MNTHGPSPSTRRRSGLAVALLGCTLSIAGAAEPDAGAPSAAADDSRPMTQTRMEGLIREFATDTAGRPGWLRFVHEGVPMVAVSDTAADRMRITAPIARVRDVSGEQLIAAMEANFHSALDARYATSDGILHVVYVHPLSPLTPAQLRSAVDQVATASRTFGTGYTSGLYNFGGRQPRTPQSPSAPGT